mmetsp:Transcript_21117/g.59038  ORF Transcript_21117/g.59038 Transcript_21117/m.59038 type:complete len:342 (+) Transcript_21117:102-1127(+)
MSLGTTAVHSHATQIYARSDSGGNTRSRVNGAAVGDTPTFRILGRRGNQPPQAHPPAKRFWSRLSEATDSLFCPSGQHSDDPLVEVVRRDPTAAVRFIRTVMRFGGVGSVVVCTTCALFLCIFWRRCGGCDRPLRWWLLMHTLLQVVQIPVRFVFLSKMHAAEGVGGSLEACVTNFTACPAWRWSKKVSVFLYGWFVLGIVWVVNAGHCDACPGMYRMTVAVIFQAVARAIVALVCFRFIFDNSDVTDGPDPPKVEGATADQIASLPMVHFSKRLLSDDGASCAVCLGEYMVGESMRRLPCGHYFHRRCADRWLRRSKRCPLCMRAIDAEHGAGLKAKRTH